MNYPNPEIHLRKTHILQPQNYLQNAFVSLTKSYHAQNKPSFHSFIIHLLSEFYDNQTRIQAKKAHHFSHFTVQYTHFYAKYGRNKDVGTHGSCVRSSEKGNRIYRIVRADARTVRPYIRSAVYYTEPYCDAISAISPYNMAHFSVQYS